MAALSWDGNLLRIAALALESDIREIVQWVSAQAGDDAVAGIDAPLVIPNATGMRDADKLAHSRYGKYHAGAYPASRERRYWKSTTGLSAALARAGFAHGGDMPARASGRFQIEVHPHAAVVQLFGLDRIIKYKKGTVRERAAELARLRQLMLDQMPWLTPPLDATGLPELPETGRELKAAEDRIDAVTCAYVAAHWWFWGRERNDVLGDARRGYIVVPQRRAPQLSLAALRENYRMAGLSEADAAPDPVVQFERWFSEARGARLKEPNAMTLATSTPEGVPSARVVLLKEVDESGFVFFTNYGSRKGMELDANPHAALVFYWADLERQVRVEGTVERLPKEASDTYFHLRPRGSQLGAWASRQSSVVPNRRVLDDHMAALEHEYESRDIPLPAFWGGYRVRPVAIEFWQGRPSRLHDRFAYSRQRDDSWKIERLAP